MTALTLTRENPAQNMARFYRLDVQPDLFGGWCLWREWGRIGQSGTVRHEAFLSQKAAEEARCHLAEAKSRRGYVRSAG
ncbi:MAG: WGR domain-containing protein [Methylobacterium sp.]|jgi:predicted DNA-binding WGR domain protein|nr:WGR domain-containing protein [Hyphomonadaceae bacterium]